MQVFVTGGTGLVGQRLVRLLLGRGDQVKVLSRRAAQARQLFADKAAVVEGDPMQPGDWMNALGDCDGVIHLAGENVFARRWNARFKALLVESRAKSTHNVVQALQRQPRRADGQPKTLVNASAIGYYGPHGDEEVTEDSPPGNDFLTDLCVQWEAEARKVEEAGVRCAVVRVGVVLDKEGGALAQMLTPFKMGVGGPVGSGRQYLSWIHHEDLTGIFLHALDHGEVRGPLNGTAPHPVTNKEFGTALGKALHRPSFLWTPGFVLKVALGEGAEIILNGQKVIPKRTLEAGYSFKYPTVDAALKQLFSG